MLPKSIENFIRLFSKLPAIGPRQATRLAFYLLRQGKESVQELDRSLASLGQLETCSRCFFPYEPKGSGVGHVNLCAICSNPARAKNIVAIVEKETDLLSLEKTKTFQGHYLILGDLARDGILEPDQKLRLQSLKAYIEKEVGGKAEEILLALNPTTAGDIGADIIKEQLKTHAKKITRLGRGLPTGGEIEFADEDTLGGALENRK
jgi:recombination protein RecR